MRTLETSKLGQDGAKALLARYARSLPCVRRSYDETTRERVKTVELIVRESSRRPHDRPSETAGTRWRERGACAATARSGSGR